MTELAGIAIGATLLAVGVVAGLVRVAVAQSRCIATLQAALFDAHQEILAGHLARAAAEAGAAPGRGGDTAPEPERHTATGNVVPVRGAP